MKMISECKVSTYPFTEGESVIIQWRVAPPENAVIDKLLKSIQGGIEVVHAILVKTKKNQKPFVVSGDLLKRVTI